jgi:hypothetical protein
MWRMSAMFWRIWASGFLLGLVVGLLLSGLL